MSFSGVIPTINLFQMINYLPVEIESFYHEDQKLYTRLFRACI